MSAHSNPSLASIDEAMMELEPILERFGSARGFTLLRSHAHSYNIPRRWLHRDSQNCFHEIGLIIALPMPQRLERGYYPEIPCTLYIYASNNETHRYYHAAIVEEQPFVQLAGALDEHLAQAGAKLDACTPDFIDRHGLPSPLARTGR